MFAPSYRLGQGDTKDMRERERERGGRVGRDSRLIPPNDQPAIQSTSLDKAIQTNAL